MKLETELQSCMEQQAEVQQTPSVNDTNVQRGTTVRLHGPPSIGSIPVPAEMGAQKVAPPSRQYAIVVKETRPTKYKMTVHSRGVQQPEEIKQILKTKISPAELNVGINTLKSLSGSVLIETNSIQEIEVLEKEIQSKCGEEFEARIHRLRKPRIIILNVPADISTSNIEDTIIRQNPNLNLKKGSMTAKFTYDTKWMNRNAVLEVGADTRKTLLSSKIRLGLHVCRFDDYVTATRCFKCSKFNHWTAECRGEVTFPLCAGPQTIKECKSDRTTHKCINCATYNKHNPINVISANHSALDR